VEARLLHAPPPLATCGFHAPPQERQGTGWIWLGFIPSSLPRRRCAKHLKMQQAFNFSFSFLAFRSASFLIGLFFLFVSPSLFQVAGYMTKRLSTTVLLLCLAGGDGGE